MKYAPYVLALVVLVGAAYLYTRPAELTGPTIKVGVATILSGDLASFGPHNVNAASLAIEDINASGGINGQALELVVADTACDGKTGLNAIQKLVNADGVKYIVGPTCSNASLAGAPVVNERQVVYITPATGGENIDKAGEFVFRVGNADALVGVDVARAMKQLGFSKVAVIAEVTDYTLSIKNAFTKEAQLLELPVVMSEEFQPGTVDFKTLAAKAKSSAPEAILVASQSGIGGAHFIKQIREQGVDSKIFADFTFVLNEDAKKIVGSFEGTYFAAPAYNEGDARTDNFLARYEEKFGTKPLVPFLATGTYDSVMMTAEAIRAVGDDTAKVQQWLLTNIKNYDGLSGVFSFDAEGNSDRGFSIKQIVGDATIDVK